MIVTSDHIEKSLVLSTCHMPETKPDFGGEDGPRVVEHEFGYIVFVIRVQPDDDGDSVPKWLRPIMDAAYTAGCSLIVFDRAAPEADDLDTYEW